jgi:hypothetical protein
LRSKSWRQNCKSAISRDVEFISILKIRKRNEANDTRQ